MGDPFFSNVKLLLGFEGVDASTGAPGMTDESPAAHGLPSVVSGQAQIDTAQFKFGGSSLQLDGAGDYLLFLDSVDWTLSSSNSDQFTVECWVRFNSLGTNRIFMGQYANVGNYAWSLQTSGTSSSEFQFFFSQNGTTTNSIVTTGAALATGAWYHLAADKDASGKIRVYKNGVMLASSTPANSAIFNATQPLGIGATSAGAGPHDGWIDELRITKGIARYASDSGFTVPAAAFPRTGAAAPIIMPAVTGVILLSGSETEFDITREMPTRRPEQLQFGRPRTLSW